MHILYLCQYFPPDLGAPATRCHEFSRRWVAAGHRVSVICGIPNHPSGTVAPGYSRALLYREMIDGIEVHRSWVFVTPNAGALRRGLNYLSFCISSILSAEMIRDVDVCISSSPQMLVGFAGLMVKRLKSIPLCMEIRDLWPDSIMAVDAPLPAPLLRGLRFLERAMYRHADRLVAVSPAFREHIIATGGSPTRLHVVPNGVHPQERTDSCRHRRYFSGHLANAFLVGYVGTLGMAHGLESMLQAARLLRDRPDIHFILVGDGAERRRLMEAAQELPNVSIWDPQPHEVARNMVAELDIGLVLLKDTPLFRGVIPSKMLEIMGAGVPVILGVGGQAREILEEAEAGIAIVPENPVALAEAVEILHSDPDLCRRLGRNGRSHVNSFYHLDALANRYQDVLEDMIQ